MKLIWTDPSIEGLTSIRDYIARDSEHYAAGLVEQVVLSVEILLQFPRLGRVVLDVGQPLTLAGLAGSEAP